MKTLYKILILVALIHLPLTPAFAQRSELLETFLRQKIDQNHQLSQTDYQGGLRIIQVYKLKLTDLFELKSRFDKELNLQPASLYIADIMSVQIQLDKIKMESQLHCRMALTDRPWDEVKSTQTEKPSIYAGCWTSVDEDPVVKAGYDLNTLQKSKDTQELDSIMVRRR